MFVTLTYANLPDPPCVSKRELQLFFKRLRKHLNFKIRYYACGEYGENFQRPHYHAIIFGLSSNIEAHREAVKKSWTFGFVYFGDFSAHSAQYVAGYVAKKIGKIPDGLEKEFTLMSRKPALGSGFLDKLKDCAFLQFPYDVLSTIRVSGKNFLLDRTIRNKLRKLVMNDEEIEHIKKLRIDLMKDELCTLIGEHFGRSAQLKFKAPSDITQWDAYLAGSAYEKAYFEEIDEKEKWLSRRSFRKDI